MAKHTPKVCLNMTGTLSHIVYIDEDTSTASQHEQEKEDICKNVVKRLDVLFRPILFVGSRSSTSYTEDTTHLIVRPEAFRMWFYIGFWIYCGIAFLVALIWADIDVNDTPILHRFGANNICIYFDYPPFSHFGATLWVPQVINLLLYNVFDFFRVYDEYQECKVSKRTENVITKTFLTIYFVCSCYEAFATIFFLQITATTPFENMYLHSFPFILLIISLWIMSVKHFFYYVKSGFLKKYYHHWFYYLGIVYIAILGITAVIKLCLTGPNLFEAYLWKREGFEWTQPFSAVNDRIYTLAVTVAPILVYFIFAPRLRAVTIKLGRTTQD